jgi:hypothetical protein
MFGAFVRAISKALRGIARTLRGEKGEMERPEDEVYVWNRYTSDLCERICLPREGVWKAVVTAEGDVKFVGGQGVPPAHPNCDCAMLNMRTGQFRWKGSPATGRVSNISELM